MPDELTALRDRLAKVEADLLAMQRTTRELLTRLRTLLPPHAEAALAAEFAAMIEAEDEELDPDERKPLWLAIQFLYPERDGG